ncbi:hypothetical protein [Maribacter halichondriae]|uniref:hypothetical protein n=1 Tax=Maribacter halichondriae TaxID=2980554 RepID=UPI00235814C6|nr:hypothetical protein [Maribacter sp. Hal144]
MKKAGITFIIGFVGLCSILAFTTLSQERLLLKKITERLLDYNRNQAPEKTYLHTDKDLYTNGETIWFKTYLVDGISHSRTAKSNVVYVELVNNQDSIVAQRKLFVNDLGASGDIEIDETIPQGDYTLRSYTKYMLNEEEPVIFEKNVPIFVQEVRSNMTADQVPLTRSLRGFERNATSANTVFGKPNIKFFPEGGNLVQGLPATMGLEVLDAKGNGIAFKGAIKDKEGNVIEPFESLEFGLGSVGFTPLPDTEYYASVVFNGEEERFPLPKALSEGYVLSLKNRKDHLLVQVASNEPEGLAGTILVGHLRGDLIFKRIGQSDDNDSYATKIYTDELQDGVAQFTLFAPDGEPVSERLIFIDDPDNDALLTISAPAKEFGKREKVDLNVTLTDEKGKPLKGDFSMSVVSKTGGNVSTTNIKSWLLLDSDLGGTVQNPDYFFADDSQERKFLLDALMLTHGWRRFVWKDMLSKNVSKAPTYAPEKGIMIDGRTTVFGQPFKTRQTVATLNIYGPDILNAKKETTSQGKFSFGPFYFQDSLEATVEAYDSIPKWEYKRKNFSIVLEDQRPELPSRLKKTERTNRRTIELAQEYLKEAYEKKVTDFKYDPKKVTRLDEVVVSERKNRLGRLSMRNTMQKQLLVFFLDAYIRIPLLGVKPLVLWICWQECPVFG